MKRIIIAVALINLFVPAAPLRAEAPFDGEWKGVFYPQSRHESVCQFQEKFFDLTVKENKVMAVIDQKGSKRQFEGSTEQDGKVLVWGMWDVSRVITH